MSKNSVYKPRLDVVTTIYNDGAFVRRLFNSLLLQQDTGFTHYIYDDGSTEPIDSLVLDYQAKASSLPNPYRVVYIKGKGNLGVNKAHEAVFKILAGDYFTWIDADDWVGPDFVKCILRTIDKTKGKYSWFHINSYQYDMNYKRYRNTTGSNYRQSELRNHDQFINMAVGTDELFAHHFVIDRRVYLRINPSFYIYDRKNGFYDNWYDSQIMFELSCCHTPFYYIAKPLSCILNRPSSVSRSARNKPFVPEKGDWKEDEFHRLPALKPFEIEYRLFLPWKALSLEILDDIRAGRRDEYKDKIRRYFRFLKKNKYNVHFFCYHTSILHALIKRLLKIRR